MTRHDFVVRVRPVAVALLALVSVAAAQSDPEKLASRFAAAVRKVNEEHAARPGTTKEPELAKRLPADARAALDRLLEIKDGGAIEAALFTAGEAALDLDLLPEFGRCRKRLGELAPAEADRLGNAVSRARFLVRGIGGLETPYLERFADVADAVLDAYDTVFGFAEWSKVPGKKLRFRVKLVPKIEQPPHFAPEFPFHSEIDFPVVDARELRSPTADGKFLFYGLCHELGHVIAMWGDRDREEDRHAWAHYTGVVIVEHLAAAADPRAPAAELRDAKWRSLEIERKAAAGVKPSTADRAGVMALLVALHDAVGPKAIGEAINRLDAKDQRLRINRVRYYGFAGLKASLLEVVKAPDKRKRIESLLP
jgi:hypothetical protein